MEPKQIIEAIKAERPEIRTLYFVGCGASSSELYPAEYFMNANAKILRTGFYTANEFNYATFERNQSNCISSRGAFDTADKE